MTALNPLESWTGAKEPICKDVPETFKNFKYAPHREKPVSELYLKILTF